MFDAHPFRLLMITLVGLPIGLVEQTMGKARSETIAQAAAPDVVDVALPISFVSTNQAPSVYTVRTVPGYAPRFSSAVGSGGLVLNGNREVTGYYFTVGNLDTRTAYAYHFHAARHNGIPTSCEGDKALLRGEAPGEVIADLGSIAPLQPSRRGVGIVGLPGQPIALPHAIPLSEIGYLNIHPIQNGSIAPGVICANVRLNPGGFIR